MEIDNKQHVEQVVELLKYLYNIHIKGNNDSEGVQKVLIKEYLSELAESFNKRNAFKYLKSILSEKLNSEDYKNYINKCRTYRDWKSAFKNGIVFKDYPSRQLLIKTCFDFDIRTKDEINTLFDNLYTNRLYLKDRKDFVYYFFLTGTEKTYDEAKAWIEKNKVDWSKDCLESCYISEKYTSEIYNDIKDLHDENDLIKYIINNFQMFDEKKNKQFTAKQQTKDILHENKNDPSLLQICLFDIWSDVLWDEEEKESSNEGKIVENFSTGKELVKIILRSFGSFHSNDQYDFKQLISDYCQGELFGENVSRWEDEKLVKLDKDIFESTISRGSYLLLLLSKIDILRVDYDSNDWEDELSNELERAGFAALNPEGVALDRVICDFIEGYFELPLSFVRDKNQEVKISDFVSKFIESLAGKDLDYFTD